ncbi:MAG: sulfurtransferase [Flavobacteriaceae bacterium]|nr:sulfurtransferase [Flavobacteriaceae bacterium]
MLKINSPLVSVNWLYENLEASNLIILNATIKKVTTIDISSGIIEKQQIKNTRFLDIKNKFSDLTSELPNTMLSPLKFTESARQLGICNDSAIVVYDELGIYSSPRVWWMFKVMGHHNIAVLDGGLPEWGKAKLPLEKAIKYIGEKGDFTAKYNQDYISNYNDVFTAIDNNNISVLDARSENRFNGLEVEPRKGLRSGHIPSSVNLPYSKLIEEGKIKSKNELKTIFTELIKEENRLIFSCGSGITACILALGAEISGLNDKSVYDGSWTEWGSR